MSRVHWQQRLLALTLAGGGVTAACVSNGGTIAGGPCNANPDPCCGRADGPVGEDLCKNGVSISGPNSPDCVESTDPCCGRIDAQACKGLGSADAVAPCSTDPDPCCGQPDGTTCRDQKTIGDGGAGGSAADAADASDAADSGSD